jgi:hypothetical protein
MNNITARTLTAFRPGGVNLLYLRFVELFSYFAIVFVARLLSDFRYESSALLVLFLGAAIAQYSSEWVCRLLGSMRDWPQERRDSAVMWYSSFVDIAVVVTLIYFTGGIESPFFFLITVPLFFAGNMFPWKTTIKYFLSTSMILIGAMGVLELEGIIPHHSCYWFESGVYQNRHFLAGSLLVMGAFVSLVLFLSSAFQNRLTVTMERLRRSREESESRASELSRLYDISLGINAAMSIETLLRIVAKAR